MIIVTAPYIDQLDILAGTSALSGEELTENLRGQLGDSLTSLPGVSSTSFAPGSSRPVLRGFQGPRVKVLTDGIGSLDASNTSVDHAVTIDPLTAQRIEVLRGPAVLLFGGDAIGGAVNVIDKRIPRDIPDEAIHVDAIGGYGSAAEDWSIAGSVDAPLSSKLVLHLDGSFRDTSDVRIPGFVVAPGLRDELLEEAAEEFEEGEVEEAAEIREAANERGRITNSASRTQTAGAGIAFIDDGGNLGVSGRYSDPKYGVPGSPGVGHPPGGEGGGGEGGGGEGGGGGGGGGGADRGRCPPTAPAAGGAPRRGGRNRSAASSGPQAAAGRRAPPRPWCHAPRGAVQQTPLNESRLPSTPLAAARRAPAT